MKTKPLRFVGMAFLVLFLAGCASQKSTPANESCSKLAEFLRNFHEECPNPQTIVYDDSKGIVWDDFEKTLCATFGCTPPCKPLANGCEACLTLGQIWPEISFSSVKRIVFYEAAEGPDMEKWGKVFEVPQKGLDKTIQLLRKAKETAEKRGVGWTLGTDIWDITRMEIVTDKGAYVIPAIWTDEKIYGNDWRSSDLMDYLTEIESPHPK